MTTAKLIQNNMYLFLLLSPSMLLEPRQVPSRERGVKLHNVVYPSLIGQLSFLLVSNMVLAKTNIHKHRTK